MRNKILIFTIFIISVAIIYTVVTFRKTARIPGTAIKPKALALRRAPGFTLSDINGKKTSLADFKGKVVILDFWATWCPPCRAEIPHFIELYDRYRQDGLEIVGVALDHNAERVVAPFAKEYNINYTLLLGTREVANLYGGIISIPTTFLIDRDGNIRKRYIGYREKEVFEKDIKEIL